MNSKELKNMHENKRSRKSYTIEEKMEVIKRMEKGHRPKEICQALHMSSSTVCTIIKMRDQIQKQFENTVGGGHLHRLTKTRHEIFEKMEKSLIQWIDAQGNQQVPITTTFLIKKQALKLFKEFKEKMVKEGDISVNEIHFKASPGWFDRFRSRSHIKRVKLNKVALDEFNTEGEELENGYINHKNVNMIGSARLVWKRMSSYKTHDENEITKESNEDSLANISDIIKEDEDEDFLSYGSEDEIMEPEINGMSDNKGDGEKVLDSTNLKEILDTAHNLANMVMERDSDKSRSLKFKNSLYAAIECYRELYETKT